LQKEEKNVECSKKRLGLLPSLAPLYQLRDLSAGVGGGGGDAGRFAGQFVAYENDASMVTFNDMFVAVQVEFFFFLVGISFY
jgi:hypothetical protein